MTGRLFVIAALTAALIVGCKERMAGEDAMGRHTWPMSEAQLEALKKMPRPEREAWFAELERPKYTTHRREGTIKLDGVLDEPAWQKAEVMQLREGALGGPVKFATRVRMLWDDEAIYAAFECDDPDVHAPLFNYDDDLWKHDLVELFIDTEANANQYMELHAAPSGAMADVVWADFSPDADWFATPGWKHFEGLKGRQAFQLPGMEMAVKIHGTLNDPSDTDKGYAIEWRIPYAGMRKIVPDVEKSRMPIDLTKFEQAPITAPTPGTVWRMNFNRCDDSIQVKEKDAKGKMVDVPEYSAWAPTTGSNHMPFLFGYVTFAE